MATGATNAKISGIGDGDMQWLPPFALYNGAGTKVFGVDVTGALTSSGVVVAGGIETGLTAHSGGGQASALALSTTKNIHVITTVAAGNDSVKLPAATGSGSVQVVFNGAAANSAQVFGSGTDTINGVATGTGVALAAGKSAMYVDYAAGTWFSLAGA